MVEHSDSEVERLFDELIELDPAARALRLAQLAPDTAVARQVDSLLSAAIRAGDFLGVLDASDGGSTEPPLVMAGRYRIERTLGSGAMGDVYLARDSQLERQVALKVLRSSAGDDDPAQAGLVAEARAAARLDHAHVATVYDVGEDAEGRLFIAMAYYPGETLRDRIARGPLAVTDAVRIAAQIADSLAAAHDAGIIHRDVKPANVLFDAAGAVKLADFGVAKREGHENSMPGVVVGTLAYMSPEQARGEQVDGRSDLWALGVILHEMLTGRRPGAEADVTALPEGALRVLVPALLSSDPRNRPAHASSVHRTLSAIMAGDVSVVAMSAEASLRALPSAVTSFVGREPLLALARSLLTKTRLLTLTGPGGTGKTRLALQLAAAVRGSYTDDVWFVPLADITDPAMVPSSVARVLGIRDAVGEPVADRVIAMLGSKRALVVLDNFEHVLDAAPFVARLLAMSRDVTVLATSRAPLEIQGEQELPVPPLATPARLDTQAAESEAVQLFVQRARAVRPDFALDEKTTEIVAEVCRRLDGLPLAVELAAARAKLLSPRVMLARLENRLDVLRGDERDRPARHRTLREVIDWSYVLLTEDERALFTRLAVLGGGISVEAAEAVGGTPEAFDLLTSLCNKSLLRHEEHADGETRFLFLETVREFALERLREGGQESVARDALRGWCVAFAERATSHLRGPSQLEWFDRIQREYANLRGALDDAIADGARGLEDAARLGTALHRFWLSRGPLREGVGYLRRIIAANDAVAADGQHPVPLAVRAKLFNATALIVSSLSMFPEMRELLTRSLALHREAADAGAIAVTLNNLGWAIWIMGDLDGAVSLSTEAMEIHREAGDELGMALSLNNLAWIATERGEYAIGERYFTDAIAIHRRRGDQRSTGFCLTWLGLLMSRLGDHARALALHEEALAIPASLTGDGFRMLCLIRIAGIRHALREPGDHVADVENVYLPKLREWGGLWPIAAGLAELGAMLLDAGQLDRARAAIEEEIDIRRRMGAEQGLAEAQLLLATVLQRRGDRARAGVLLDEALEGAKRMGTLPTIRAVERALDESGVS